MGTKTLPADYQQAITEIEGLRSAIDRIGCFTQCSLEKIDSIACLAAYCEEVPEMGGDIANALLVIRDIIGGIKHTIENELQSV
ncbi:MAG: hypothetical protein FWF41_06450 [Betaproteobacteria bacterium]|nr:hypothetical protein [Betaproteobacteria bacterium]